MHPAPRPLSAGEFERGCEAETPVPATDAGRAGGATLLVCHWFQGRPQELNTQAEGWGCRAAGAEGELLA